MKIANRAAREHVQSRAEFTGSNLFAKRFHNISRNTSWYVVYSYGTHWPLFVCDGGVWFENEDSHSRSTARHHNQCHPQQPTTLLSLARMEQLAYGGYQALVKERLHGQ